MECYPTVIESIAHLEDADPGNGYIFQSTEGEEVTYSYARVARVTSARAAALQAMGLGKGDRVALIVVEPEDFVLTFIAALKIGAIPVPLYPPITLGDIDAYTQRTARILNAAGASHLIFSTRLQNLLWQLKSRVPSLRVLARVESLREATGEPVIPSLGPEDIAFLQYTSGATSDPKGVMVTHAALAANARAILVDGLQVDPERDVGVSWLPLYHDMGLIGFVISGIFLHVKIVLLPTMRFIKRPSIWMEAMHRHHGTISFAPPFAFGLAARKATTEELARWDLSHVRVLGCGAEPIHPETLRRFEDLFAERCGLSRTAILPAYGMAEATLAITFKPLGTRFKTRTVDADRFETFHVAEAADGDGRPTLEHVSCGLPFPGHDVIVVDEGGRPVPEGVEGEIWVRGPSITPGYFREPESSALSFRDGWLHTGDLGYLWQGELYVTGRLKDLIILHGRNIHPQLIEWAAAEVPGVRRGNVVAFSRPGEDTEEVVVALELRNGDADGAAGDVPTEVKRMVQQRLAIPVAEVVCLSPGLLPKTSSGKLQRRWTRQQYLNGKLGKNGMRNARSMLGRIMLVRVLARSLWSRVKAATNIT